MRVRGGGGGGGGGEASGCRHFQALGFRDLGFLGLPVWGDFQHSEGPGLIGSLGHFGFQFRV